MKKVGIAGWCLLVTLTAGAQESFEAAVAQGDSARGVADVPSALAAYRTAANLAVNDTERGIALGKQAEVQAQLVKDFSAAKALAEQSLALPDAHAVSRVVALQVLAASVVGQDENHARAVSLLEEAARLEGVDWAKPTVLLSLGDARRMSGAFDEALAAYGDVLALPGIAPAIAATAHLNTGLTYQYSLMQPAAARDAYARAVELQPGLAGEINAHLARLSP
jgi:tetratricopeptide (TPR) repeat protein